MCMKVLGVLLVLGCGGALLPQQEPSLADGIARDLEKLGAPELRYREEAFQELLDWGAQASRKEAVRKELRKAAKEGDEPRRAQATELLRQLGILDRMPEHLRPMKGLTELLLAGKAYQAWEMARRQEEL